MFKKFSEDWKIKLFCIFIAFSMWIFVMEEIDPITVRSLKDVPVDFSLTKQLMEGSGLALSPNQNLTVDIDFRSKRSSLADFIKSNPVIVGKVEEPKEGENIAILFIDAPSNIEYSFNPTKLVVKLEERVSEERDVEISLIGNPYEGFEINKISSNKNKITIEGAKNQVKEVSKLLARIDITDVSQSYSTKIEVIPVNNQGDKVEGITIRSKTVVVNLEVRAFKDVPVSLNLVDSNNEVIDNKLYLINPSTIKISGDAENLETVTKITTQKIFVDKLNNREYYSENGKIYIKIDSIDGVDFDTDIIALTVDEEKIDNFVYEVQSSQIENKELADDKLPNRVIISLKTSKEYSQEEVEKSIRMKMVKDTLGYKLVPVIDIPIKEYKIEPSRIYNGE